MQQRPGGDVPHSNKPVDPGRGKQCPVLVQSDVVHPSRMCTGYLIEVLQRGPIHEHDVPRSEMAEWGADQSLAIQA